MLGERRAAGIRDSKQSEMVLHSPDLQQVAEENTEKVVRLMMHKWP